MEIGREVAGLHTALECTNISTIWRPINFVVGVLIPTETMI
jgi:hypothetical protein